MKTVSDLLDMLYGVGNMHNSNLLLGDPYKKNLVRFLAFSGIPTTDEALFVLDRFVTEETKAGDCKLDVIRRMLNRTYGNTAPSFAFGFNYAMTDAISRDRFVTTAELIESDYGPRSNPWCRPAFDFLNGVSATVRYIDHDVKVTKAAFDTHKKTALDDIDKIIVSGPVTTIIWKDKTKSQVRKQDDGEDFDYEKGVAMAICKHVLGNDGSWHDIFALIEAMSLESPNFTWKNTDGKKGIRRELRKRKKHA